MTIQPATPPLGTIFVVIPAASDNVIGCSVQRVWA
jgi:hypothetical protein